MKKQTRLEFERRNRKIRPEKMADVAECTKQTYYKDERGNEPIPSDRLQAYAKFLGLTVDELLSDFEAITLPSPLLLRDSSTNE